MIKKITICDVASFNSSAHTMEPLKEVNYIYGANGSGKTTISRLLEKADEFPRCSVEQDIGVELPVVVYNNDFVKRNFSSYAGIKSIFTVGEGNVTINQQIEEKKEEIRKLENDIVKFKGTLDGTEEHSGYRTQLEHEKTLYSNYCWSEYLKLKDAFAFAFRGYMSSKAVLFDKFRKEYASNNAELQSLDYLERTTRILMNSDGVPCEEIVLPETKDAIAVEQNPIWAEHIVGSADVPIAALINELDNADWVNQGRKYLDNRNDVCPFCQNSVSGLKEQLDLFFDKTYEHKVEVLRDVVKRYENGRNVYKGSFKTSVENLRDESKNVLLAYLAELDAAMTNNLALMEGKVNSPGNAVVVVDTSVIRSKIEALVFELNKGIRDGNALLRRRKSEEDKLRQEVWRYLIEGCKQTAAAYEDKIKSTEMAIKSLENKLGSTVIDLENKKNGLAELQSQLVSVVPTIDAINRVLKSFGFTQIKLEKDTDVSYKVVRPTGEVAQDDTLSEGERTFLSFLYFYNLLRGGANPNDAGIPKIVVIDDPVSSLDGDILFIVSTLVRNLISDVSENSANSTIKQLFILTHNVYFHKEIAYNQKRTSELLNTETFWVVRRGLATSSIVNCHENPIKSSYELLWRIIKHADSASELASVRNTMRRILEHYFGFLGGQSLAGVMEEVGEEDKLAARSLLLWMHDGSHTVGEDLFCAVNNETVDLYKRVFRKIFEIRNHIDHYNMMMGVSVESDASEQVHLPACP